MKGTTIRIWLALLLSAGVLLVGTTPVLASGNGATGDDPPITLDDRFRAVAQQAPGFGGMFLDDGGLLTVHLLDPRERGGVQASIERVFGPGSADNLNVLPATYGFLQLDRWHGRLGGVFELSGVLFTDIDERGNQLQIGVDSASQITAVESELSRLNVPRGAVDIVVTDPVTPVATLRDRIRPIQGGLQIAFSGYLCTLGFNGVRSDVGGFVVNSHCTNKQGGVESTLHYQPSNAAGNFIGTEIADPRYTKQNCPPGIRGKVCRWSDSAYDRRDPAVTASLGFIARPTALGSINIAGTFRIVGEGSSLAGQVLNKVGRTTGWSQGKVTNTCVNTGVWGSNILQRCQDFVSAAVGSGDSGSTVFAITNSPSANDVSLRGILWGSSSSSFVYSPIGNIQRTDELGPITTCAPGFVC